nr:hypothetical protein [Tanacetum cinerariifolium]
MAELFLNKSMEKAQSASNLFISSTNNDTNIKLSKEFLTELQNNTYHGIHHEDVVDHIAMVLEMLDLINIPGVDSHQLRIMVFPLSLADDARQRRINEGEGKITTREELVEKFISKFYPKSYDGEEEMLDEGNNWGIDPFEFISRGRYGVSVPALTKDHEGNNIQYVVSRKGNTPYSSYMGIKYSERYQAWSLLQETLQYVVYKTLDTPYRTDFRRYK